MSRLPANLATDAMFFAAKQIPGLGTVAEYMEMVNNNQKQNIIESRLANLESTMSYMVQSNSISSSSISASMQGVFDNLGKPNLKKSDVAREISTIRQIQAGGWQPSLFERLFRNSPEWENLRHRPEDYGDILQNDHTFNPDRIRILIDLDQTRVIELTPYALEKLLSEQPYGVPRAKVIAGLDVWGYSIDDHSNILNPNRWQSLKSGLMAFQGMWKSVLPGGLVYNIEPNQVSQKHTAAPKFPFRTNGMYIYHHNNNLYNVIKFYGNNRIIYRPQIYTSTSRNYISLTRCIEDISQNYPEDSSCVNLKGDVAEANFSKFWLSITTRSIGSDEITVFNTSTNEQFNYKFMYVENWI